MKLLYNLSVFSFFMSHTVENTKTTAKDFFFYLAAVVTLFWSAVSLLILLSQIINGIFPDPALWYQNLRLDLLRGAMASLIVVFPSYFLLIKHLNADLKRNPEKAGLWVRRWLVYFTLFVSFIVIIARLVTTLNVFLGGELTIRFVLNSLSIFAVAGGIFGYYWYDLKRDLSLANDRNIKWFAWTAAVFVSFSLVAGFTFLGSPAAQRDQRLDEKRTQDLQTIQWRVVNYWQTYQLLPETLDDLKENFGFRIPVDPETGLNYEYEKTGENSFQLCAEFNRASRDFSEKELSRLAPVTLSVTFDDFDLWEHSAGRNCFERNVDFL